MQALELVVEISAQAREFFRVAQVRRVGDLVMLIGEHGIAKLGAVIAFLEIRAQGFRAVIAFVGTVIGVHIGIGVEGDIGFLAFDIVGFARLELIHGRALVFLPGIVHIAGLAVLLAGLVCVGAFGFFRRVVAVFLRGGEVADHVLDGLGEGGLVASLVAGAVQARIAEKRAALMKDIARRKVPVTGVSEFPLLDEIEAPVADAQSPPRGDGVDPVGLQTLLPDFNAKPGEDAIADPLTWITLSEPFEMLRDRSEAHKDAIGDRPSIFLATLGPLAEHTARVDFARNMFAVGGLESKAAPVPPESPSELAAAFRASGCEIAVLCGADKRYVEEAGSAAAALKEAGAGALWLAGKHEADGVDRHIFMGCDVVHELTLALAELGVN